MAAPRKRSVTIRGHRTSLSLEPPFWRALNQAAEGEGLSINELVARIDTRRTLEQRTLNLSSAIRCWLFERLEHALALAQRDDHESGKGDQRSQHRPG